MVMKLIQKQLRLYWLPLFTFCLLTPQTVVGKIRFATFNVSMNRNAAGQLAGELETGNHQQISKVAAIIRTIRPDVILLNEFDYTGDQASKAVEHFQSNYLSRTTDGLKPIRYAHVYTNEVNTGLPSGKDLDGNGQTDDPTDCFGFGRFPGQYGMVVLSRFPLGQVRTFQKFLWKDMPGALLPHYPDSNDPYYSKDILDVFRLSSKSHWDIPIKTPEGPIHFLVCHPTPPVFDGPEDKNGTRNHDEIRFWADYISPQSDKYMVDDAGQAGGLAEDTPFVIAGDFNADPIDGDSTNQAITQLLNHPLVRDPKPQSQGAKEAAVRQGKVNDTHRGRPELDTGDFSDRSPGNLRVDYVLPAKQLKVLATGVYWPAPPHSSFSWLDASDHRLVWLDVKVR